MITPCVHIGDSLGLAETAPLTALRSCVVHGRCTLTSPVAGVACCETCCDYRRDAERLISPLGKRGLIDAQAGWIEKKSWKYPASVCLPHLDTLELLRISLDLWRAQTVRPYRVIIDTGSTPEVCGELERLRSEDCEIHYIRKHSWLNTSAPVAAALDLAQAMCDSPYILHTHVDVFPTQRTLLAHMLATAADVGASVVGWEMAGRDMINVDTSGMVSHTCTLVDRAVIQRLGLLWSLPLAFDLLQWWDNPSNGWPDTQTAFNLQLRRAGITPLLLGRETDDRHQVTPWWEHMPGFTTKKLNGQLTRDDATAMERARRRAAEWSTQLKGD